MNEEYLLGEVIKSALEDLKAENMRLRVKAYLFLYRKYPCLMGLVDLDTNYLVKRYYGSLKPIEEIEKYLEKIKSL